MSHYVYRYYGPRDDLVYVGCSKDPWARYKQHRTDSSEWIHEVTFGRIEVYPDQETARRREREAIETEHPRYNRTFRTDRAGWTAEHYLDHARGYLIATKDTDKRRVWNSEYMAQVREEYAALAGAVMPRPVVTQGRVAA